MAKKERALSAREAEEIMGIREGQPSDPGQQAEPINAGPLPDAVPVRRPVEHPTRTGVHVNIAGNGDGLDWERPSAEEDEFQRRLFLPKNIGDTFIGRFVSFRDRDELGMKYDAIEMRTYPDGVSALLPSHEQLKRFFRNVEADTEHPHRAKHHVFRLVVDEVVMDKDVPGKVAFVHYDIHEANPGIPANA